MKLLVQAMGSILALSLGPPKAQSLSVSPSTPGQNAHRRFETILLDLDASHDVGAIRESLAMRFVDAQVAVWGEGSGDIEPPFVMVKIRRAANRQSILLRLLTQDGAVYLRELSTKTDTDAQDQVVRELSSLLLAVEEGLVAPDEIVDPDTRRSDPLVPEEKRFSPPLAPAPERRGTIQSGSPGPARRAARPSWDLELSGLWAASMPLPRFEHLGAGGGGAAGAQLWVAPGWALTGRVRWMAKSREAMRLHRVGIFAGAQRHWKLSWLKSRYRLEASLLFEPWWIRARWAAAQNKIPVHPKALLGMELRQSLAFPAGRLGRGNVFLGPVLGISYSGMIGAGLSSLGIYLQEPATREHAFARMGGLEAVFGVCFFYSMSR